MEPKVTFIVPCYNLAHFLPECVRSILEQSFTNFEVLIMDDCSPDNTPEVVRSFNDARIRYVRNEMNLGNIRNYNKGLRMAFGAWTWLISADDVIRDKHALDRYLRAADTGSRRLGVIFSPHIALKGGKEDGVLKGGYYGEEDLTFRAPKLGEMAAAECPVPATSAMVRLECYVKTGYMDEDLPRAADWMAWGAIGMHYDAAYLAQPTGLYRLHDSSMEAIIKKQRQTFGRDQDLALRWKLLRYARQCGDKRIQDKHLDHLVAEYAKRLAFKIMDYSEMGLDWSEMTNSFVDNNVSDVDRDHVRNHVSVRVPDWLFYYGRNRTAAMYYLRVWRDQPHSVRHLAKMFRALIPSGRKPHDPLQSLPRVSSTSKALRFWY